MNKSKKVFLLLIFFAIIISISFIFIIEKKEKKEFHTLNNATLLIQKLNSNMLMLRRYEKDFLSRKDETYIKKHRQSHEKFFALILSNIYP